MNPKPFFVSNHFTLPDAICFSIHLSSFSPVWQNAVPKPSERRCTSKDFLPSIEKALPLSTLELQPIRSPDRFTVVSPRTHIQLGRLELHRESDPRHGRNRPPELGRFAPS